MKRKLAVAAILMLFCIAFVFASGAKDSSSEDQVVLRFSWWGSEDRHMATIEAIERYMELNPNVLIEYEYMGFQLRTYRDFQPVAEASAFYRHYDVLQTRVQRTIAQHERFGMECPHLVYNDERQYGIDA